MQTQTSSGLRRSSTVGNQRLGEVRPQEHLEGGAAHVVGHERGLRALALRPRLLLAGAHTSPGRATMVIQKILEFGQPALRLQVAPSGAELLAVGHDDGRWTPGLVRVPDGQRGMFPGWF